LLPLFGQVYLVLFRDHYKSLEITVITAVVIISK